MLPTRKGVLLTNSWGLCKDWYKSKCQEVAVGRKIKDKRRKIDLKDEKKTHK